LGPVLFLIFINQIGSLSLKGKLFLFADDITILYTGPDLDLLRSDIQSDCICLTKFINSLKLTANALKTKLLVFSKSRRIPNFPLSIQFHGQEIECVSSIKFLGLFLDSSLTWENHVKHGIKKVRSITVVLSRLRSSLPKDRLTTSYFSLIHSRMSYLSFVWGRATKSALQPLLLLQNWSLRV